MSLFGTDGVRGVAGRFLTAELAVALGRAATEVVEARRPQVLIVRDTRESGPMLVAGLSAGIAQAGGDALIGGVLPTPAASILVRKLGLDLAAVVSASHNAWRDNGIKFFGADGTKLGDELEARIERAIGEPRSADARAGAEPGIGRIRRLEGSLEDYLRALAASFSVDLSGRRIVLDCANGATHRAAPAAFRVLGAELDLIGVEPDGRNINDGCGSTHPQALAARVRERGAELGFAFDGDGDRVVAVDSEGRVRDGDELIALAALHLRERGGGGGVAVTVMSNYGFHQAMKEAGVEVATTPVGDRNVSSELERRDWALGGEQSGHIIWREFAPTGDGIAAALLTLTALGSRRLVEVEPVRKLPQLLRNLEVADRAAIEDARELWIAVERESAALEGRGRVLVRGSGTEPLLRVMVEAPSEEECAAVCERLAELAARELGATPA